MLSIFLRIFVKITFLVLLICSLAGCSDSDKIHGYIEGRYTYIAANGSGILTQLDAERGTQVTAGKTLFLLDPQPEISTLHSAIERLKQANAQRDEAKSNLALSLINLRRNTAQFKIGAIQKATLDSTQTDYDVSTEKLKNAEANVKAATADLDKAHWSHQQKTVAAPVDGLVFDTYFRVGELVSIGQPVLSILAPKDIKVIFYIPELSLARIALGDRVKINCDSCEKPYTAKVSFISPTAEYTPPVIFSNETRDKLIYRIEAEFKPSDAIKLHPGQPIYTTFTHHHP